MPSTRGTAALAILAAVLLGVAPQAQAQSLPAGITEEQLEDNKLFLALAKKALHWEEPAEPVKIAGPLYFVGTKGLGVFLFATLEGHILMNTGMPSSGSMIVESIKKLGLLMTNAGRGTARGSRIAAIGATSVQL